MKLDFIKMQAGGNDYIYVDCYDKTVDEPAALAKKLSIRRFSVGSDGLVLILPSDKADAKMRIFNADGSEAEMCGNAIRCVAKYLYDSARVKNREMLIETLSGVKRLCIKSRDGDISVTAEMGKASFQPRDVPVVSEGEMLLKPYVLNGNAYLMTCVSVGNPHAVVNVKSFRYMSVTAIGKKICGDPIFPEGANVEFVRVAGKREVYLRVFERGSGETYSCGTGACAAVAACSVNGLVDTERNVIVHLKGGDLVVKVRRDLSLLLTGGAQEVYRGVIDV